MTIGRIVIALQVIMLVSTQEKHAILEITVSRGPVLDSTDYSYRVDENSVKVYSLHGEYTRMCEPAPAEGKLSQVNTMVCVEDNEDFFGQVVIFKPEPNDYCDISVYERASRIINRAASAVIVDITDNEDAAAEVRQFHLEPLNKPVVVLSQEKDAQQLWHIVGKYQRATARISQPKTSPPGNQGKVYFDLSIVLALLVLFCIICFFVIIKLKWHHRRRRQRQLSLTDVTRQIVTSLRTRAYQPDLKRSNSCSHSVVSIDDCPICLENYKDKELLKVLPCGHEFHGNCVDKWLIPHRTCPMCKYNILDNTAENDGPTCTPPTSSDLSRHQRHRGEATAGRRGASLPQSNHHPRHGSPVRTVRPERARVHLPPTDRTNNQNSLSNQRRSARTSGPTCTGALLHNNSIPTASNNHNNLNNSPWLESEFTNRPGNIWSPDYRSVPPGGAVGLSGARRENLFEKTRAMAACVSSAPRNPHSSKKRTSSNSPPRAKVHNSGSSQTKPPPRHMTQRYILQQNRQVATSSESECDTQRNARSIRSSIEPGYSSHWDADSEHSTESEGQCRCSIDSNMDASNHGTHDSGSDIPSDISSSVPNVYGETCDDAEVGHSGKDPPCDSVSVQLEPSVLKTTSQSFPTCHFAASKKSGSSTSKPAYLARLGTHSKDNNSDSNVSSIDTSDVSPFVSDCCNSTGHSEAVYGGAKRCSGSGGVAKKSQPIRRYTGSKTCECQYCKENVPFLIPGFYNNMGATCSSSMSCKLKQPHFQSKKYSAKTNYYVHHYSHQHQYQDCSCCKPSSGKQRPSGSKTRKSSLEPLQKLTDSVHPEVHQDHQGRRQDQQKQQHHQQKQQRRVEAESSRPSMPSASSVSPTTRCNICRAHRSLATHPLVKDYHPWRKNTQGKEARAAAGYKSKGDQVHPRKSLAVVNSESQGVRTVSLPSYATQQNLGHMV